MAKRLKNSDPAAIDLSSSDLSSLDLSSLLNHNVSDETLETLRKESEKMIKRREILKKYEDKIRHLPEPDGRYWIRINGKQIFRNSRKELEDAIIERVAPAEATLDRIYDEYLAQRQLEVVPTTWQKDVRLYNDYIKGSALAKMPVKNIRTKDCYAFMAHCLEVKPDMRGRYWNNIKGTVSTMFQFAIDNDYMECNYILNVKPAKNTFQADNTTKEEDSVYTDKEAAAICGKAYEDAITSREPCCLGVILLFNLGLRCGELLALKWSDLSVSGEDAVLHVQRTEVTSVDSKTKKAKGTEIVDRCKTKAGNRYLYITQNVLKVFDKIREISISRGFPVGENDYILLREFNGKICYCTSRCIDGRLRKYCMKCGITPKSAHDIRRTTITNLSNAGMQLKEIQRWAGHENTEMTQKYIRHKADAQNKTYLEMLNPIQIAE